MIITQMCVEEEPYLDQSRQPLGHRCTTFLCIWDDQHRTTNMNDEDHLVGQLTSQPLERRKEMMRQKMLPSRRQPV